VVFITHNSLTVGLKNRQWKLISTGGYLNTTASGNRIFTLAVGVTEPFHLLPSPPANSAAASCFGAWYFSLCR
jgi:hypothetical protein